MTDWRKMSNEEREALPLGSEGWRYARGSELPKGQHLERFPERMTFPSGACASGIRWGSNGVGEPVMNLFGSTRGAEIMPHNREGGWYPLPPGAFIPMKPNEGAAAFDGSKTYKGRGAPK